MRRRKATITFKVPSWNYCNHQNLLNVAKPEKTTCRFCIQWKHTCTCVLTNKQLMKDGELIHKTRSCIIATCGFGDATEICEEPVKPAVDPKMIAKVVLDEYRNTYKGLIDEGYSAVVADKVAREVVLGHGKNL